MASNGNKLSNREIARAFRLLADLMELHGENPYKIRAYQNAYIQLRKLGRPLAEMDDEELARQKGVGKAIFSKIKELLATGRLRKLEEYLAATPAGVVELLEIKGLGPKKVRVLWQELGIESPGELLYAINENRLLELKGFGPKTRDAIREQLLFWFRSQDKFHYATVALEWPAIEAALRAAFAERRIMSVGAFRRKCNVVDGLEVLIEGPAPAEADRLEAIAGTSDWSLTEGAWTGKWADTIPLCLHFCTEGWGTAACTLTGDAAFVAGLEALTGGALPTAADEAEIFAQAGCQWVAPELREGTRFLDRARRGALPVLIETTDIKGVIHAHSTWSDGIHSLREMALAARARGYAYLVISDHSRSAFYANGLDVGRVRQQWEEIDRLNEELAPFRIFKSIESDILADGSLDYDDELLAGFDLVIASVHSHLRMDEQKATERLLKAIAHPATRILGHPTGRLLLSRPGYPIDYERIIEACAAHGVAIELNANPHRLDLDWQWIPAALEAGVWISINPDAHSTDGIDDIRWGVASARKGGLDAARCLSAFDLAAFEAWLHNGRRH